MIIGIPVYDGVDLLDVAGPHEIFGWMDPKVDLRVVAASKKTVTTRDKLGLVPSHSFDETPALDVLWVPGGDPPALKQLMTGPDRTYLDFLVSRSAKATYVCSVCEGALLLAQAGLLDGYQATTHWAFVACLKQFRQIEVADGFPRYVLDRNRLTGGGISSGLDEALMLVQLLRGTVAAQDIQRTTQYYPDPPVHSEITPLDKCPFTW